MYASALELSGTSFTVLAAFDRSIDRFHLPLIVKVELEGLDRRGRQLSGLLRNRPGQMLPYQLLDFSPAVVRRRLDPMVGVLSAQDPRDGVQLGPAEVFDLGPCDAGFDDGVINLDPRPRPAALDGGVFLNPPVQ